MLKNDKKNKCSLYTVRRFCSPPLGLNIDLKSGEQKTKKGEAMKQLLVSLLGLVMVLCTIVAAGPGV
ncbi:MAG: hypothetical protein PHS27_01135 [Candidatus Pacebacteria bacterium]|nr:hypothetical protein [Candidatus Paceibacterota bacterium]